RPGARPHPPWGLPAGRPRGAAWGLPGGGRPPGGFRLPPGFRWAVGFRWAAAHAHIREETSVKVLLIRRWGSQKAHTSVVVDEKQGAWLVDRGWGVEVAESEPAREVVSGDEAPARHARRAASPSSGSGRRARKPKVVDEESSAS